MEKLFTQKIVVALAAILCCLLWGSAFPAVKVGYNLFNISNDNTWLKILFAGYRFLVAALMILLFAWLTKNKLTFRAQDIKHFIILGLISTTIQYIFFYVGLSNSTGVKGSILISAGIFFTVVIAHLFFHDDKITKNKIVGLLLGAVGVFLVNFSFELLKPDFTLTGEGFIIISQLAGAISSVYVKKVTATISVIALTAYQMLIGSLLLILPASIHTGWFPFQLNPGNLILYLYLALISAIAFTVWNIIVKYNQVGKVIIYQFFIPVFGVILSALFLKGEQITISTLLALVLVSVGIISVNVPENIIRRQEEN